MKHEYGLTEEQRAVLEADIAALPPLTDEQLDAIAEVIAEIRLGGRIED